MTQRTQRAAISTFGLKVINLLSARRNAAGLFVISWFMREGFRNGSHRFRTKIDSKNTHAYIYTHIGNSYTFSVVDKLDFCKRADNHVDVRRNYPRPDEMIKYVRRTQNISQNGERRLRAHIKRIFFYTDKKTKISFKIIWRKKL